MKEESNEKTIDVEVNLGREAALAHAKMPRNEQVNHFVVSTLKNKVQTETIEELEHELSKSNKTHSMEVRSLQNDIRILNEKLRLSESYVEQARGMISSVTERWYEYETDQALSLTTALIKDTETTKEAA